MIGRGILTGLALVFASGCFDPPPVPEVYPGLATVPISDLRTVPVDAVMPSDLLALGEGRVLVLDGYAARGWVVDTTGNDAPKPMLSGAAWGRPVRATTRSAGGFWLAEPGDAERTGLILAVNPAGLSVDAIEPTWADQGDALALSPTAVLERAGGLVIGDRFGRVAWLAPGTGDVTRVVQTEADGERLGAISDLGEGPDGTILAVGATSQRIHVLGGDEVASFGRFGDWAGTLRKPKSIALGTGGVFLVADSALGVVQIFEPDGRFLGVLSEAEQAVHWPHPIAVRSLGDERYAVLDSVTASVTSFRLDPAAISSARGQLGQRHLRTRLIEKDGLHGAKLCRQCHDGFVKDSREVWDPRAQHHPVDVVPERELPPFFPLSEAGEIVCATCHSPHGVVEEDAALGVESDDELVSLLRHSSEGVGFIRLSVEDSALCTACHEDAAHESALARMDLGGGSHPVGEGLEEAMAARPGADGAPPLPEDMGTGCLGCHATHGAASEPMLRAADDGVLCVTCHEPQASRTRSHPLGATPGSDVPRPRRAAALLTSRDGGTMCRTCHDGVGGTGDALLRRPRDGGQLCLACHDERKAVAVSPHGKIRGSAGLPCLGCHDVHGLPLDDHFLRTVEHITEEDPQGCLFCHGPRGNAFRKSVRPGEAGHAVLDQPGGLAQSDPPLEGCPTCHDAHTASAGRSESCGDCHPDQDAEGKRGGHGDADCLDCHPVHADAPYARVRVADVSLQSSRCLSCHSTSSSQAADVPRVEDYEHPEPVFLPGGGRWKPLGNLPLFGADGKEVAVGDNGDLACGTCHRTHGPDPEHNVTALRRPGWESPCSACHGDDALSLYLYFHEPDRREASP